jgi:predicted kinase
MNQPITKEHEMSKGTVVILRGPSGAGKSTVTKAITAHQGPENVAVCSADEFFMHDCMVQDPDAVIAEGGEPIMIPGREYRFNPTKLGEAHAWCYGQFLYELIAGKPFIIVDNTNIHMWEWTNYAVAAKAMGYTVDIQEFRVETVEQIQECQRRNVHRVPADIVARMCLEFEPCGSAKEVGIDGFAVHQVFPQPKKTEESS